MPAPTLYVSIRGDYTQYQKDLARVRGIARQQGEAISNVLNDAISPRQATQAISSITQALMTITTAAREVDVSPFIHHLDQLAGIAGTTQKDIRDLVTSMNRVQRENNLSRAFNEIYQAVSDAGAALSLTTEDMEGVFLALGQMISKGKVQAEELRGQLGERLPGAFQMAAKAMNMTTAELDKFMADGKLTADDLLPKLAAEMEEKFAGAAVKAADTLQGSLNNMQSAWETFKNNIAASGPAQFVVQIVTQGLDSLNQHFDEVNLRKKAVAMLRNGKVSGDSLDQGIEKRLMHSKFM